MKYFFIPGRLYDLSWKELNCVCEKSFQKHEYILKRNRGYFLLDIDLDIQHIFSQLGGFIKYGEMLEGDLSVEKLTNEEKFIFGISSYSSEYSLKDVSQLAQELKKEFSNLNKKSRFILPKDESFLTAAQILQNRILQEGFELAILEDGFGKTIEVQNIDSFSKRDYEKPFVDTQMGVLPIKLARMMINFAKIPKGGVLWDPFCGTGNILLEGMDLGYDVIGSDIDEKSIEGAKKNIEWAKSIFGYSTQSKVLFFDVLNPSPSKIDILKNSSIEGIVCEPYMGEAQRKTLSVGKATSLINRHLSLVEALFVNLNNFGFKKNLRVVVVFPEYKTYKGWMSAETSKINFKNTKLLKEEGLHWSRRDSIIRRLIFIFEYNFR
jgi:tRNA G10  N-methylase Trm11